MKIKNKKTNKKIDNSKTKKNEFILKSYIPMKMI